jgi:lipopolysaccharide/colanic/teichoic acid biosynthesis glycosyltransferase
MPFFSFFNSMHLNRADYALVNDYKPLRLKIKKLNFAWSSPGYRVTNELLYRLWNLSLLVVISFFALPAMGVTYALLRMTQCSPIIYKGIRLGRGKKPFIIYKFRTLVIDAEKRTRTCVLPALSGLETRLGKFLRDSRLDELPQLFNVLRGDMNLFGPRPVRRVIARQSRRTIPNYDRRFSVKPGLVGYAQLYMTHRTPKAIRARLNVYFCKRKTCFWKEPFLMALTVWGMAQKGVGVISKQSHHRIKALMPRHREVSACIRYTGLDRMVGNRPVRKTRLVYVCAKIGHIDCLMLSINHEAIVLLAPVSLDDGEGTFLLQQHAKRARRKMIRAKFKVNLVMRDKNTAGSVFSTLKIGCGEFQYLYIAHYKPLHDFDAYIIDKFFLRNSILM